jgi:hypothetical protein
MTRTNCSFWNLVSRVPLFHLIYFLVYKCKLKHKYTGWWKTLYAFRKCNYFKKNIFILTIYLKHELHLLFCRCIYIYIIVVFKIFLKNFKSNYYLFQSKSMMSIFGITFDTNKIEVCSFHHSKDDIKLHWAIYFRFF